MLVGGIVGFDYDVNIEYCYNSGNIYINCDSNASINVGGIAGGVYEGTISNCIYVDSCEKGIGSGSGSTTKSTKAQMKEKTIFSDYDFNTIWTMDGYEEYPYPELIDIPMVYEKKVNSIEIFSTPTKDSYAQGLENLNLDGGKIAVYFEDEDSKIIDITDDMVSGFDNSNLGDNVVTVTYKGKSTTFTVLIGILPGKGTAESPYLISSAEDLDKIRKDLTATYQMTDDIIFDEEDFSIDGAFYNDGTGWKPIGTDEDNAFSGYFDGNGHLIKGILVDSMDKYVGVFGCVSGTITQLGVTEGEITTSSSPSHAGAIAGRLLSGGEITKCFNSSDVSGSWAGGIAGTIVSGGSIENCYNIGTISGNSRCGGITANCLGTISKSYNVGSVAGASNYTGAICGNAGASSSISDCYYDNTSLLGCGSGTGTVIGCTLDDLKSQNTYVNFDFENNWEIDSYYSVCVYPTLIIFNLSVVKGLELIKEPLNKVFCENSHPNMEGSEVKVIYDDGTEGTGELCWEMISDLDISTYGEQTVCPKYEGVFKLYPGKWTPIF